VAGIPAGDPALGWLAIWVIFLLVVGLPGRWRRR